MCPPVSLTGSNARTKAPMGGTCIITEDPGLSWLSHDPGTFSCHRSAPWTAWRRVQRLDDRLPARFADVLDQVIIFAGPVLAGTTADATWNAAQRQWHRPPATSR